jgi:hypothetical protein
MKQAMSISGEQHASTITASRNTKYDPFSHRLFQENYAPNTNRIIVHPLETEATIIWTMRALDGKSGETGDTLYRYVSKPEFYHLKYRMGFTEVMHIINQLIEDRDYDLSMLAATNTRFGKNLALYLKLGDKAPIKAQVRNKNKKKLKSEGKYKKQVPQKQPLQTEVTERGTGGEADRHAGRQTVKGRGLSVEGCNNNNSL